MTMLAGYKNEYSQEEQKGRWIELIAYWRLDPDALIELITGTEVDVETGEANRVGIAVG